VVADVGLAATVMITGEPFIISADSHVTEPADLWCQRLDRTFRDRAPRVVRDYGTDRYLLVAPGISPFPIATGFGAGKHGRDLKQHLHRGYEAARAGGWDPVERVKDQDADGVGCEVLYPTHGMKLFALADAELQRACFRVYNDWIVGFVAAFPKRLVPLALISLYDVPEGVREVERVARMGAAGVLVWGSPPETVPPYGSRTYDPVWAAAASLGLPVSLHCITSGRPEVRSRSAYVQYLDVVHDVQRSLAEIVCGGVLERFPELIVVSAENDCGWFPHFLFRLDHAHEKFGRFAACPLPLRPSEYFRRQVYATFQEDSTVSTLHDDLAAERYMWASDYPHADSTWPNSRRIIAQTLGKLPDAALKKMIGGNAARLYLSSFAESI
jgi:predicted TIM-barrel fold metal-dependent hydrolase